MQYVIKPEILRPLAQRAGLKMIGQSNLGESEHDFRVPDGALHGQLAGARGWRVPSG
jgi:hypothetical protein